MSAAHGFHPDVEVRCRDYRVGCVGAGMIMAECHLAAYREAGFPVAAIASRTRPRAAEVARRYGIAKVHDTPQALIEDAAVEIVDLAFPPDQQPGLIRHALGQPHVKAILAQKPLALSLDEAIALRDQAVTAGKILSVNQNMRYDQAMRVLKEILDRGALGEIVFAQIDMHAIPHWQEFLASYDRLTLSNMSVHHLDVLRFLFGEPLEITTLTRKDPRTALRIEDGIVVSVLKSSLRGHGSVARGRLVGLRARRATRTTSTSAGAWKGRKASPRARSAGRPASRRRSATRPARRPAADG